MRYATAARNAAATDQGSYTVSLLFGQVRSFGRARNVMSSRWRVVAPTPLLSGSVSGLGGRPVTPLPFFIGRDVPRGGTLSMRRRVSARLAFGHTPARPVSPAFLEGGRTFIQERQRLPSRPPPAQASAAPSGARPVVA